jgi:hypothetical protein
VERTFIEALEDRLRQVWKKPGDPDDGKVHEKTCRSCHDDGLFEPAPHRRAVEHVENTGQLATDRA